MLDEIREKLEREIASLTVELSVELPERIRRAVELGDLRENAEYKSALERQQFVQARIGHLTERMSELSRIDPRQMPFDRVGFGSRVRVHDVFLEEEVILTVVASDFMDLDGGHVSMASPIGRGLLGSQEGDEVTVELPVGVREFRIIEVITLPQQLGLPREEE